MGVLVAVLRFVVILLVVRLVMRAIHAVMSSQRKAGARPRPAAAPAPDGGHLVRDRICNTFVPPSRALSAPIHGKLEHFCSESCREKALAEVARAS